MVNLELYKIFYTVARCGSLTKAAEEMFISQPAASQAIRQLESQLHVRLFKRTHKGMELTAQAGAVVYEDVERALRLLEGVEDRLALLNTSAAGTLRIGASATIFEFYLAEKIVDFHNKYPQVKIELVSEVSPRIVEQLKGDRCDIGFLNLPIDDIDGIEIVRSVGYLNDAFVAGRSYLKLRGRHLNVWDLQNYPLLLMKGRTSARSALDNFCASHGAVLQPSIEVDSWNFMKMLIKNGMGIGCIPREYIVAEREAGEIFELDVIPSMPSRSVCMALPKGTSPSFALRAFIDLFDEAIPSE